MTRLFTADASQVSPSDFLRALRGKPPLTASERVERQRQAEAYWAERREANRREIGVIRERLCALASPDLAAEFRAKWAAEDAERKMREAMRRAA